MSLKLHKMVFLVLSLSTSLAVDTSADERTESFDRDPGWEGHNNRALIPTTRTVRQDFGYSFTNRAGGTSLGELGGFISPAAEPAYYAKRISAKTFDDALNASGRLACTSRQFHVLIAFFNSNSLNEWRTPNTIALRLYGRGDVFYAYVEYATARWRAGGDSPRPFPKLRDPVTGRTTQKGFASEGAVHRWSLQYDPQGNQGGGRITARIDDQTAVCDLAPGHKDDGAAFDRFGLLNVMKHFDGGGELWLDDITIDGQAEDFGNDPQWDSLGNRRTYVSDEVRPRFDFGHSKTQFAGGRQVGELGGLVFRGDNRYPDRMAYYADRLHPLSVSQPLKASGKVSLHRGVTDSTTLIGFFHSTESMVVSDSQDSGIPNNFLGIAVEGPSREGFYFYPLYRLGEDHRGTARGDQLPRILPDGRMHDWTLAYSPTGADGSGSIIVSLDKTSVTLDVTPGIHAASAQLDRFGIITTWIDGNGQRIYFDDLTYTWKQD